ncbi:MAG TPA: hypothetical protein VH482_21280 [Thermomicrobiales bacterium]
MSTTNATTNTTTSTKTTDTAGEARREELARKIARVYGLRDPLGAKGFRATRSRLDHESQVRRGVFAAVLACFVSCFGLVTVASRHPNEGATARSTNSGYVDNGLTRGQAVAGSSRRALAEAPRPHLRTRAS